MSLNMALRIVSSLVLAPIVLCAIWFGKLVYEDFGIPLYSILLAVFGAGLAWEWETMFRKTFSSRGLIIALTAFLAAFISEGNPTFVLWLILLGTTAVMWKTDGDVKFALGVPYICLPVLSLGYIYYVDDAISREIVLWLFFVVWATDIGGLMVGSTLKGPKLAPRISPKKTWSGFIGAILFAIAIAYVFVLYLKANDLVPPNAPYAVHLTRVLLISALVLSVVSQIGDLFESGIKRKLGLKDSSNLIPGHGGLFDRVDGLLFASVVAAAWLYAVNNGCFFR